MTIRATDLAPTIEAPGTALSSLRSAVRRVPLPLVQAVAIVFALYVLLEGWHRDISMPLAFSSDSLWYLMQSKSTVDNGWWWWNPRLGAPYGLDELAYPSNSTVDQALVWVISRVVPDAFAAVNLTWGLVVVLSGLSATWCLQALGVSRASAFAMGTLFALSPYALYRNIDHFALVIYLVPFACAASLWLAAGEPHQRWGRTARIAVLAGCALLGINYVYYAFFASFCLVAGALIGYAWRRDRRLLVSGALGVAVIAGSTILNLAPTFYSWHEHGRPLIQREKTPAEAEMHGLKIRQLISPVYPHTFPPFNRWVEREAAARFPNDYENWSSRLGIVATLGFLAIVLLVFLPEAPLRELPLVRGASRLTLAVLLLATVGGFGAVFNLAVSPDIRAYNRMSPFIAFFSLLAVATAIDRMFKASRARSVAAIALLLLGTADQGQATRRVNERQGAIAAEVAELRGLADTLERALPDGAMVFQLPIRTYMSESDFGRMKQYDHFKPYLVSETLRFSYPAFSNEQVRWQRAVTGLDVRTLATRLAARGFSAVLVDRYGYEDQAAAVVAGLRGVAGDDRVILSTDRFFAVDIGAPAGGRPADSPPEAVALTLSMTPCPPPASLAPMVKVEDQVDQIGLSRAPFGATPASIRSAEDSKVSGWAVDAPSRAPASGVDVVVDRMVFPTIYGAHRNDVAQYFGRPNYRDTGFNATIPANALSRGEHWLNLRVVTADGRCYFQSPAVRVNAIE